MKKTKKKSAPRASRKKIVKDLEVQPSRGGAVRGGLYDKLQGGGGGGGTSGGGGGGGTKLP